MLLAKTMYNTIGILISETLIDPFIDHDEFISVNNMLKEYSGIKEEVKIPKNTGKWNI